MGRPAEADAPLYGIATVARLTGMHPQTLRKYERAGLLRPARHESNQRIYSEADVVRLRRIQYLVDVRGLNVAGLALMLRMTDRLAAVREPASAADLRTAIDEAVGFSEP